MKVTKRDGRLENLDIDKIHKVVMWACDGLKDVSVSEIEIKAHLQFYDKIKTSDIHETLIKSASNLISEDTPNYQYVAGRLVNFTIRKDVYGQFDPIPLYEQIKNKTKLGFYTEELLEKYTEDEINLIDKFVKHDRDLTLTYAAIEQIRSKYLIQNKVTKDILETPQMMYVLLAMALFGDYKENRIEYVQEYYDAISQHYISLPTPILAGLRTPIKQFASCVLIETDDSIDSIQATTGAIVKYVSQRAGIGIGAGKIRALGSKIRNGDSYHTGVIPYYKLFQAAVQSVHQGGVRPGAATLHYPLWHLEIEDLLVLKNNKGIEENRVRNLDYSVQLNKLMYERLLTGGVITLFSPHDVDGLYDAFFADQDEFKRLYEKAENNKDIRKKQIPAIDLFNILLTERKDTGRIYIMNVDHCNGHSGFNPKFAPIKMSNLCQEILINTSPITNVSDENGEVATCILSALNWGKFSKPEDMEKYCKIAVRALDTLIDYQTYPLPSAENSTKNRRSLGVGIINYAYWLAKNGMRYDETAFVDTDKWMQHMSYYLIKASNELAKEFGACAKSNETMYAQGVLPIDTYKDSVDELVAMTEYLDWESLRNDCKEYGIRNSVLMAIAPTESSSLTSNATNGIEPPRSLITTKLSKNSIMKQVVPEIGKLKNKYDLLWEQKSPDGYLKLMAIMQKYIDQSISTNTSYTPSNYPDGKIPMSVLMSDLVMAYKYGLKTLYYNNTHDMQGEEIDDMDAICETCSI